MKKGLIQAVAVFMVIAVLLEGVYVINYIYKIESIRRTVMEGKVLEAINKMEMTKRSLQQSLTYSFYQASYDVSITGGTSKIGSKNGISYWRNYGNAPYTKNDFIKDLESSTLPIFNEYAAALNNPVTIPTYSRMKVGELSDGASISTIIESGEKLQMQDENGLYDIEDNPNTTQKVKIKTFTLFNLAERNFLGGNDKVGEIASQAVSGCRCGYSRDQIISKEESGLNGLEKSLSSDDVKVEFLERKVDGSYEEHRECCSWDEDGDCTGTCCVSATCTGSIDALVKMTDSATYPIYDGKDTGMKNLMLQFYVVSGASASG